MSWGSNVTPPKFGRGAEPYEDWVCICGTTNKAYFIKCEMCELERKFVKKTKGIINEHKK